MNPGKLVAMANQISRFFAAMPDREKAKAAIADHIKRMWEPRMRKELFLALDETKGSGMDQILREALEAHRGTLNVAGSSHATAKAQ